MISRRKSTQVHQGLERPPVFVDESKYVQQHLANERTFLAWIRTIISILGVGFVTTTLHFEFGNRLHSNADLLIKLIGLFTIVFGFVASVFAAVSYLQKREGINHSGFHSTGICVIFVGSSVAAVLIAMACYMALAY